MSGGDSIPFTLKGPISVQAIDNVVGSEVGRKTGCAVVDLKFPNASQIGELVLTNYYTAWVSIYVKKVSPKSAGTTSGKLSGTAAGRARPQFERSISVDIGSSSGNELRIRSGQDDGKGEDLSVLESLHSSNLIPNSRRRHSSGPNSGEISDRSWECSIPLKTLMPCPHFESGCQESFSIPATESLVEWKDVIIMRIILHQPSTVWKRFTIVDVNVFKNLPKRGYTQFDDICRQRDGWLATLRLHTKKMLGGQLVEPEKYESDEDGDP